MMRQIWPRTEIRSLPCPDHTTVTAVRARSAPPRRASNQNVRCSQRRSLLSFSSRRDAESAGCKRKRRREMLSEVAPIVSPGIQMKFVGNAARSQESVKFLGADVKAE